MEGGTRFESTSRRRASAAAERRRASLGGEVSSFAAIRTRECGYEPYDRVPDASARVPGPRPARVPLLHVADRRALRRRVRRLAGGLDRRLHAAPRARSRRGSSEGRGDGGDLPRLPRRLRVVHQSPPALAWGRGGDRPRRPGHPRRRRVRRAVRHGRRSARRGEPGQLAGVGRRVVGRPGHRRLQPAPGPPARRRQRRHVGTRAGAARTGAHGDGPCQRGDDGAGGCDLRLQRPDARLRRLPRPAPRDAAAGTVRRARPQRRLTVRRRRCRARARRRIEGAADPGQGAATAE